MVKQHYPDVEVLCPASDADMLPDPQANLSAQFGMAMTAPAADRLIQPGETLEIGPFSWKVLDTSGHTPGGVSYYCPQAETVLTGDALFAGSIGRSDIPQADGERLLKNIHAHLLSLPENTRVLPGHGPASTIGLERKNNPFLR
jgi:glyoxylase-like metal-dependent hydrolase (beta-lactamase superfamily II)